MYSHVVTKKYNYVPLLITIFYHVMLAKHGYFKHGQPKKSRHHLNTGGSVSNNSTETTAKKKTSKKTHFSSTKSRFKINKSPRKCPTTSISNLPKKITRSAPGVSPRDMVPRALPRAKAIKARRPSSKEASGWVSCRCSRPFWSLFFVDQIGSKLVSLGVFL